jgi:hypothetical protein
VTVHVALPGPIDTVAGVANGDEEIFPDPMSGALAPSWRDGAIKTLERQNANAVRAVHA